MMKLQFSVQDSTFSKPGGDGGTDLHVHLVVGPLQPARAGTVAVDQNHPVNQLGPETFPHNLGNLPLGPETFRHHLGNLPLGPETFPHHLGDLSLGPDTFPHNLGNLPLGPDTFPYNL